MPLPDPRKFPPTKLAVLLNSFPHLGQVVTAARIRKHVQQAGMQISNDMGETVDILRYTAWLANRRHSRKAKQAKERPAADSFAEFARRETEDINKLLGTLEK